MQHHSAAHGARVRGQVPSLWSNAAVGSGGKRVTFGVYVVRTFEEGVEMLLVDGGHL